MTDKIHIQYADTARGPDRVIFDTYLFEQTERLGMWNPGSQDKRALKAMQDENLTTNEVFDDLDMEA